VASSRVNVSETARNLGVIVDSQLTLSAQVAAVCRSGCHQLRQLRPLVRSMSSDAVKTLVQAFISCRLDYCNSMFYGITDEYSWATDDATVEAISRRAETIADVLQQKRKSAQENITAAQAKQKKRFDLKHAPVQTIIAILHKRA